MTLEASPTGLLLNHNLAGIGDLGHLDLQILQPLLLLLRLHYVAVGGVQTEVGLLLRHLGLLSHVSVCPWRPTGCLVNANGRVES